MPRSDLPWYPRYPGDWLNDPAVRKLNLPARAIWGDMIDQMYLQGTDCVGGTFDELARLFGCSPAEVEDAVQQLASTHAADVNVDRNGTVTVRSRRVAKELKARETNRLRQQRHRGKAKRNAPVTPANNSVTGYSQSQSHSQTSEVPVSKTKQGSAGAPAEAAAGAAGSTPEDKGQNPKGTPKPKPKTRDQALLEAADRFITRYPNRNDFAASDATIRKKFYALVECGAHEIEAIFWLLEKWARSEEWLGGFQCGPDKFLAKSNLKYRRPPPDQQSRGRPQTITPEEMDAEFGGVTFNTDEP